MIDSSNASQEEGINPAEVVITRTSSVAPVDRSLLQHPGSLNSQVYHEAVQTNEQDVVCLFKQVPTQRAHTATHEDPANNTPQFEKECGVLEAEHPEIALKDPNGWTDLSNTFHKFDEQEVENQNQNIDTLLVFAGLFSAILTAFIIEAYKMLQRDSTEISDEVLLRISQQLSSFVVTSNLVNSTFVPPNSVPPFTPDRSSVWVNTLWFAALILSLIAASLGMLVKQWLREYVATTSVAHQERCRVRWFRRNGLLRYKVTEIATFLPLLLQVALILFFAGLIVFIWTIHKTIALLATSLVMAWLLFLIITTLIPILSPSCPYKTPFLNSLFRRFRHALNSLAERVKDSRIGGRFGWELAFSTKLFVEERDILGEGGLYCDTDVLFDAYTSSRDVNVFAMVTHCVDLNSPSDSIKMLTALIRLKHGSPISHHTSLSQDYVIGELRLLLISMTTCIRKMFTHALQRRDGFQLGNDEVDALITLARLEASCTHESSSDHAQAKMVDILLRDAFAVPSSPEFLENYISWRLEGDWVLDLPERVGMHVTEGAVRYAKKVLALVDPPITGYEILQLLSLTLVCAGRSGQDARPLLIAKLPELTAEIASQLKRLPRYTECDPCDVFRWHCVLDAAIRMQQQVPGVIDKSLFEALHSRSVKMFHMMLRKPMWVLGKHVRNKPKGPFLSESYWTTNLNWVEIVDQYVEVEVRGVGEFKEYGHKWDYNRLIFDCKHRIEFMLNFVDTRLENLGMVFDYLRF